jgi:hypothetical protein
MRTRAGSELAEQVMNVRLHRVLRQEELGGDLAVDHAVCNQLQDLELAIRQRLPDEVLRFGPWQFVSASPSTGGSSRSGLAVGHE